MTTEETDEILKNIDVLFVGVAALRNKERVAFLKLLKKCFDHLNNKEPDISPNAIKALKADLNDLIRRGILVFLPNFYKFLFQC
jgi:hypothetical protein